MHTYHYDICIYRSSECWVSILGSHLSEQPPGRPPDDNAILNRRKGRDMSQPEPSRSRLVLHHKLWILRGARFGYYAGWKGGRESRGNPRVRHSGSGIRTLGPPSEGQRFSRVPNAFRGSPGQLYIRPVTSRVPWDAIYASRSARLTGSSRLPPGRRGHGEDSAPLAAPKR